MTPRYRLTSAAENDVIKIWTYVAGDSVDAADRVVDQFNEHFALIARNPEIGTQLENYRKGLRAFSSGRYVIFFQRLEDEIIIYRVLHGARNFDDLL